MSKRSIFVALLLGAVAAIGAPARGEADSVVLRLFPHTGEVRLTNPNAAPFQFTLYSLSSNPAGALNGTPSVWRSISDNYDKPAAPTPGNGFIDADNAWTKLTPGAGVGASNLAEGVFEMGPDVFGSLPAFRSISLGQIWNPAIAPAPTNITMQIVQADLNLANVTIVRALDGDYDLNGIVQTQDYNIWKAAFGSTSQWTADGNLDGVVNAADYSIWRDHLGQTLPPLGSGSAEGAPTLVISAVPEPAAAAISVVAMLLVAALARRHRHRRCAGSCG